MATSVSICSKKSCLWVISDCQGSAWGLFLRDCTLVQKADAGIQARWKDLAVSDRGVFVDYRDSEGENLLGIGHCLDNVLQVLSDKSLDLGLCPCSTLVTHRVWVKHPKIDLDESFTVVSFWAKFSLRGALKSCNDLRASKSVAEFELAIWVEGQGVNAHAAKLVASTLLHIWWYGLRECDRDFKTMVIVIPTSSQGIQADHLYLTCRLSERHCILVVLHLCVFLQLGSHICLFI